MTTNTPSPTSRALTHQLSEVSLRDEKMQQVTQEETTASSSNLENSETNLENNETVQVPVTSPGGTTYFYPTPPGSCWVAHMQAEEVLGYVFEWLSIPQMAGCAMVCRTFKSVIYGPRLNEHWAGSYRQLAAPGWSPEKAPGTTRILNSDQCRKNAAKMYKLDVGGIWRVSGKTYAGNAYSYLMQLHQIQDDDEEHWHPVDFPLTYVTGHDVDNSMDPDHEPEENEEEDENPEINMHFRISGTVDGQSIIMTQVCRNNGHLETMTWTNVCHATIGLDGNTMNGMWMQQDHRQHVIQRSRATGRFEAEKIVKSEDLPKPERRINENMLFAD